MLRKLVLLLLLLFFFFNWEQMFSCSIWIYTFKLEMCVTVAVCAVGKAGSVEISCRKLCQVSLGRRFFFFFKKTVLQDDISI